MSLVTNNNNVDLYQYPNKSFINLFYHEYHISNIHGTNCIAQDAHFDNKWFFSDARGQSI